jgi:hypothetical protein
MDLVPDPATDASAGTGRLRLDELDGHLHCSVIGTCLGTAELRKLMARHIDVQGLSELEVHHEAVRLSGGDRAVARALHKALDQRHDAALRRAGRAHGETELSSLWEDSLRLGDVPGAYWALLTHRDCSAGLRRRVFGDVHMLSHFVGAANRADIRRLVALENENADLRDRLERQQGRAQQLLEERDAATARLREVELSSTVRPAIDEAALQPVVNVQALTAALATQTERRERAGAAAAAARGELRRLQEELDLSKRHMQILVRELGAAEVQLREHDGAGGEARTALAPGLQGRRILYVGGRPSSLPAIRSLAQRLGAEFQRHDGGLEDRKGLLESALSWAQLVLFPVDCIDHDSAARLKRQCLKAGTPFVPLRTASVASFAAALTDIDSTVSPGAEARRPPLCPRHA